MGAGPNAVGAGRRTWSTASAGRRSVAGQARSRPQGERIRGTRFSAGKGWRAAAPRMRRSDSGGLQRDDGARRVGRGSFGPGDVSEHRKDHEGEVPRVSTRAFTSSPRLQGSAVAARIRVLYG